MLYAFWEPNLFIFRVILLSQIASIVTFSVDIFSHLATFSHIEAFSHLRVPHGGVNFSLKHLLSQKVSNFVFFFCLKLP